MIKENPTTPWSTFMSLMQKLGDSDSTRYHLMQSLVEMVIQRDGGELKIPETVLIEYLDISAKESKQGIVRQTIFDMTTQPDTLILSRKTAAEAEEFRKKVTAGNAGYHSEWKDTKDGEPIQFRKIPKDAPLDPGVN